MTAETDITAINDGGANTASEVRTALTSVLGRADGDTWATVVAADTPVAWLKLEEASGTTATDNEGAANGTYVNTPTYQATGYDNYGITLNGTNEYIAWNTVATLIAGTEWTLEGWFKPTSATASVLFGVNDSSGGNRAILRHSLSNAGNLRLDTTSAKDPSCGLTLNNWNHVVMVGSGGICTVYLNGAVAVAHVVATLVSSDTVSIGQEFDGGTPSDFFAGTVDEMVAYDFALSPQRVMVHYMARA